MCSIKRVFVGKKMNFNVIKMHGITIKKLRNVFFKMILTYVRFLENIVYRMEQNSLTICVQQNAIVVSSCLFTNSTLVIPSS